MKPAPHPRVSALDGLRCIAVVLVLAGHGAEAYVPQMAQATWLSPLVNSSLGVRLFFVLSGFLITSLLLREQRQYGSIDWKAFVVRRALRIWPALYVYLFVMLILALSGVISISLGQFIAAATFTWNYSVLFVPEAAGQGWWFLGHLWTLALEQQFYLVWPLVIVVLGWRRAGLFSLAVPLLLPLVRVASYFLFPSQRGILGMMFHTAIDSILIGCVFSIFKERLHSFLLARQWLLPFSLIYVFVLSPLVASAFSAYRITIGFGLDAIGCGFLILAASLPFDRLSRLWGSLLCLRPLVFIGGISYGLYLWQQPFLTVLNSTETGRFPLSILAAVSCALFSFWIVEQPALRAKAHLSRSSL